METVECWVIRKVLGGLAGKLVKNLPRNCVVVNVGCLNRIRSSRASIYTAFGSNRWFQFKKILCVRFIFDSL